MEKNKINAIELELEEVPKPEEIDKTFLKERTLFMEKEFNEESCNKLKKELMYLFTHDYKKDITIYISSFGGGVYEFLMIYGLIKNAPCKITTVALGKCMSAGAYLLLCGDERLSYPDTRIMLHELAYSLSYRKLHDHKNEFKESEKLQKILQDIVTKKTKIKKVEEYLKEDQFMSPEEAKTLGIIDRVL